MNTRITEIGEKLNAILQKTYDAQKGFKKAAKNVDNKVLKAYFNQKAQERHGFGNELKDELISFNQNIEKTGSIPGMMHRAWMDLRTLLTVDHEECMLDEAIKGEKTAITEYNNVLRYSDLPKQIKAILLSQKLKIENGLMCVNPHEALG